MGDASFSQTRFLEEYPADNHRIPGVQSTVLGGGNPAACSFVANLLAIVLWSRREGLDASDAFVAILAVIAVTRPLYVAQKGSLQNLKLFRINRIKTRPASD